MATPHHRKLRLAGAHICGDLQERHPPIALPDQPLDSRLVALDIGGTLIKLVYFSDGMLRFVKFQNEQLHEFFDFMRANNLVGGNDIVPCHETNTFEFIIAGSGQEDGLMTIKATGGGAYKYADEFKEKLGVSLEKMEEFDSIVAGLNFLLKNVPGDSFIYADGKSKTTDIDRNKLFPYLLVHVGTGVSIIQVTGHRKFESEMGTQISGSCIFALAKLLTGCSSYDEFLNLSQQGDNLLLDLISQDISGYLVSEKQDLPVSTFVSSFEKVISSKRTVADYKAEDLATTLLSAFNYNIAQISFLVATRLGIKRVIFGGSYISGHPSTMDKITHAMNYWSKGNIEATFLHHEGFLGALGALTSYENIDLEDLIEEHPMKQEIMHESFPSSGGRLATENNDHNIFPYLLVDIGSGISMIEVTGERKFERIIGTHLGGGSVLGLAKLLTGCTSYKEFFELSQRGNSLALALTIVHIYGEHGYTIPPILQQFAPAKTTICSFGRVNSNKLSDYKSEDLAAALLDAFTYNTAQIAYHVARISGLKKIFFRGTYVCGYEAIMDKISGHLTSWSKGQLQTTFLSQEGFMETEGAFWSYEDMGINGLDTKEIMKHVLLGAPYIAGSGKSSTLQDQLHNNADQLNFKMELEKLQSENAELNHMTKKTAR